MNKLTTFLIIALLLPVTSGAATLDDYITACVNNKANRMDKAVCTCVGNETLKQYGQPGLDYMHASASKDSAKLHQTMASMDQQKKMGIMMHAMTAPSKCAGQVAQQQPQTEQGGGAGTASGAATAAEAADAAGN